ncbi:MAG: VWA domain-containing protein, partial [Thermoanaerobaculia bacterium]
MRPLPRRLGMISAAVVVTAVVVAAVAAAKTERLTVTITSPPPGAAVFGEIELTAEVFPADRVAKVEFLVDGELVGEVRSEPFRVTADLGDDNVEHRFEVRATDLSGELAEALLVTPAIRVDAEVTAELQQLYVTVSDGGRRVLDLQQEDFAVIDNGNRQEMVTFARGDVRVTAAVLIDSSVSMKGHRLRYALRGAAAFVQGLRQVDEASILLFSDKLVFSTPFSNDITALTAGLGGVEASGGTALNDHVYMALKRLEHRQGRRVLVLLSDGVDSHSALRMNEVTWLARRSRALIYWLRTDPEGEARKTRSSAWKSPGDYRREYQQLI